MRPELALVLDIAQAVADVELCMGGRDLEAFEASRPTQLAVQMALVIIGEAAGALPDSFKQGHAQIDWPRIVAFRNVLVHAYHGVDLRRVHDIATVEVPKLNAWLATVVPPKP